MMVQEALHEIRELYEIEHVFLYCDRCDRIVVGDISEYTRTAERQVRTASNVHKRRYDCQRQDMTFHVECLDYRDVGPIQVDLEVAHTPDES